METLQELLERAEETGESVRGVAFENETITGLDFYKIDLEQVTFTGCRFVGCDFTKAGLYECAFAGCDFSNVPFRESYWKRCTVTDCKGDGADLSMAVLRLGEIRDSSLCYANFYEAALEELLFQNTRCRSAGFQKVKWKKVRLEKVVLSGAEFFRTSLKGVDLSDCEIDGITVSESLAELKGAKISAHQAEDIARLAGVKII